MAKKVLKHKSGYFEKSLQKNLSIAMKGYFNTTNKQLAKQLGISERTLYYIKSGRNTSKETKDKFRKVLGKLGDDGLKIGSLAEHIKRTGKKSITREEGLKVLADKTKALDKYSELLEAKPNLIYAVLFYGKGDKLLKQFNEGKFD